MEYLLHIVVIVAIYMVLAVSLDLLAGHTGLLSVAHAAFFGLGAYCSALLSVHFGLSFLVGLLAGMVTAGMLSLVISLPSLRLHDDYFVIATFGFQMILYGVFNNWIEVTRGPLGVPGIPQPSILGVTLDSHTRLAILAATFAVLAFVTVSRVSGSAFGRVLRAVREDEVFAKAMGKNTLRFKVSACAISAVLAASAGTLYAHYMSYIDPTSFTVMESILVISMIIVGGAGSLWGPLVGAAVLVILPEALRFIGLPSSVAANLRQVCYGALIVVMMLVRPRGLVGRYGFGR